jgi:signal transduction histidine kinase
VQRPEESLLRTLDGIGSQIGQFLERRQAATERDRLFEAERRARADAEAAQARLAFLAEASVILTSSLHYETRLESLARLAVPTLADWCVVDMVEEDGLIHRLVLVHDDPAKEELARRMKERFPTLHPDDEHTITKVLRTARPWFDSGVSERRFVDEARDAEHLELLRGLGFASEMVLPLVARGRVLGTITFAFGQESGRRHTTEDLAVAEDLAGRAALAIDNARLYSAERVARDEAERAVRVRDEFLSIASHELRNPVAGIKGTAQLVRRARQRGYLDSARLDRYLSTIEQTSQRLAALTEDLLDVSRLQRGGLPLRPRAIDLAALVSEVVATQQARTDTHQLRLELGHQPCPVVVDPDRVEQIVTNLLENAVKYSPDGGDIYIDVEAEADGALLRVRDAGIGLPAGAAETIFEPFGRAPNAAEQNIPGLGLGLYICRRIAESHGGWLRAASAGEGQGTTLTLWLPATPTPADTASAADG